MQKKVLVANRSEIACRIFQTCREMGVKSVGIVAPGDEEARHVTYADEIYEVPSYLDIPSIVDVSKRSKSLCIHPGYGFLSERPSFARAVEEAGLVFVGPRPETMELLGGKISAKNLAAQEGVPTLPWARVKAGENSIEVAKKIGFPLLIKASAGGGGKGMRRVDRAEDLVAAAESASAEAVSAFGDGSLFFEKILERPRHIEVQFFGDGAGKGVHLYERECSLQRRHQKVWEEAGSGILPLETREKLFEAALKLVRATCYRGAGTAEFLVDEEGNFYFLEINARLQVEHPVTEAVTGVDLVYSQLSQALMADEPLNLSKTPSIRGHAIEVRLYAEDPSQGFVPTPGLIERLRWPTGNGIRIESGIEEGQRIGTQYDSMLGKLIVFAETRLQAIDRLRFALEETVILGLGTNQSFLKSLTFHSQVREGKVDTEFLERELKGWVTLPSDDQLQLMVMLRNEGMGVKAVSSNAQAKPHEGLPSPWLILQEGDAFL